MRGSGCHCLSAAHCGHKCLCAISTAHSPSALQTLVWCTLLLLCRVAALQGCLCSVVCDTCSVPAALSTHSWGLTFAGMLLPLRLLDLLQALLFRSPVLAKHSTWHPKCLPASMVCIVPLSILSMQHQKAICDSASSTLMVTHPCPNRLACRPDLDSALQR